MNIDTLYIENLSTVCNHYKSRNNSLCCFIMWSGFTFFFWQKKSCMSSVSVHAFDVFSGNTKLINGRVASIHCRANDQDVCIAKSLRRDLQLFVVLLFFPLKLAGDKRAKGCYLLYIAFCWQIWHHYWRQSQTLADWGGQLSDWADI